MKKERYESAEMEVVEFQLDDVILNSEYEGENVYNNGAILPPSLF